MMDFDDMMERLDEEGEALLLEPRAWFDSALIGIRHAASGCDVAVYDVELCIAALQAGGIADFEEASEFFWFNTASAYMGPGTPVFVSLVTRSEHGR